MKKENMAIEELMKGTVSPDKSTSTTTNIYKKIVAEIKNMKKRNMKVSSMRVAVGADAEELLLTDEKFANSSSTIGAELLREGVIGKIAGVPVKTNYLMGDDVEFVIYDRRFLQKYEIWKAEPSIEDIKDGKHIKASALQGRQVGGLMVTNKLGKKKKKVDTYTVTYDVNTGTGSIESDTVRAGESVELPDGTSLTGPEGKTVFKGWATTNSAGTPDVESPYTPTKSVTLYAVWATE